MNDNEEQTKILREILIWLKIMGMKDVKEVLNTKLLTDGHKLVYHYTDGNRTVRDFKDITGVSKSVVANYWKEWNVLGIVESITVRGGGSRAKKIFELKDFGIPVPSIPEISKEEEVSVETPIEEEVKEDGFRGDDSRIEENKQQD